MENEGGGNGSPISLNSKGEIDKINEITKRVRKRIIKMMYYEPTIHAGSSLSCVEILSVLYFKFIRRSENIYDKDWLILSKGHAAPALYAVLAETNVISEDELWGIQSIDSRLQGHPEIFIPGVDMSTGSLGQGLSFAGGVANAIKMKKGKGTVFVILGDGELDEGQVWEAATNIAHRKLSNIIAIIDNNGFQLDGDSRSIKSKENVKGVWESLGWRVFEVDGHSISELINIIDLATKITELPKVIIAKTIRGKGLYPIENTKKQRVRS